MSMGFALSHVERRERRRKAMLRKLIRSVAESEHGGSAFFDYAVIRPLRTGTTQIGKRSDLSFLIRQLNPELAQEVLTFPGQISRPRYKIRAGKFKWWTISDASAYNRSTIQQNNAERGSFYAWFIACCRIGFHFLLRGDGRANANGAKVQI